MKRILLPTLAGLAALVLLASFYQQLSRLKLQQHDVASLRDLVQKAVATAADSGDRAAARQQLLDRVIAKLGAIEAQLAASAAQDGETQRLRTELEATRQEADRFKNELERDMTRTRELVDAYHREITTIDRIAKEGLHETRSNLRVLAERFIPDPRLLDERLLAPTVQLNGDDTVGSGTLIYSRENPQASAVETYVLTSFHVIRNILADTPAARRNGIAITIYTESGQVQERGDMVSHDEEIDAALLKLRGERKFDRVARVVPRGRARDVRVWERIYAVGCPLGNDPIPTQGEIASLHNELNGANYWMINAPTYFGNSGGGIFLATSRELVGVFSKIYTHGKGNPVVVPHMGLCTPMDRIYDWLAKDELAFVLEPADVIAPDPTTELAAPPR